MHCPVWICGLANLGIVLGTVRKTSPDEVSLTTDALEKKQKSLRLKIGKALAMDHDESYGIGVVSCINVVPRPYLMTEDSRSSLKETDIDLSKMELVDFFPFTDPEKPNVRLSPVRGLDDYTSKFEQFVNATDSERKQQLLNTYTEQYTQHSSKSGGTGLKQSALSS